MPAPARSQLHDAADRGPGQVVAYGGGEAGGVGVVADRRAVLEHHRVDGAQPGGGLVQTVQVLDDQLLARVGDVEHVVPQDPGGAHEVADLGGGDPQGAEVDRAVQVAQPVRVRLPHVHRGGERPGDSGADETHQVGVRHARS